MGILEEDEDEPLPGRVEQLLELLAGATEHDLTEFGSELETVYAAMGEQATEQAASDQLAKDQAAVLNRENELVQVKLKQQQLVLVKERQAAEALKRQELAAARGFVEECDPEMHSNRTTREQAKIDASESAMQVVNVNQSASNQADKAQREALRSAAAAKKQTDRDNLTKQKKDKNDTMDKRRAAAGQAGKKPSIASIKATAAKKKQNHGESNRARH